MALLPLLAWEKNRKSGWYRNAALMRTLEGEQRKAAEATVVVRLRVLLSPCGAPSQRVPMARAPRLEVVQVISPFWVGHWQGRPRMGKPLHCWERGHSHPSRAPIQRSSVHGVYAYAGGAAAWYDSK